MVHLRWEGTRCHIINNDDNIHKYQSSFAFNSMTDGQNICRIDAHIQEECAHKKVRAISYIGAEKITFPPKPDIQTYIQTDGRILAFIE